MLYDETVRSCYNIPSMLQLSAAATSVVRVRGICDDGCSGWLKCVKTCVCCSPHVCAVINIPSTNDPVHGSVGCTATLQRAAQQPLHRVSGWCKWLHRVQLFAAFSGLQLCS
jgi:hypothetical protein